MYRLYYNEKYKIVKYTFSTERAVPNFSIY